jgi:hypothetical protein
MLMTALAARVERIDSLRQFGTPPAELIAAQ